VFADEVDDTPAAIPLLDMRERERRDLRSVVPAPKKNCKDGAVAQAPHGGDIRCIQERLRLLRDSSCPCGHPRFSRS